MIEKLIENWLINVNELGYQTPFCEVLLTERYTILHSQRGGRGEHGKDVVARDSSGRLFAFQLKGGDITLKQWRDEYRGQVEDLVRLPVSVTVPGINKDEPHTPILVTNGEIRGDATTSINAYSESWERDGAPRLQTWHKGELLTKFINAHGAYLPTELTDFREFVELYVSDYRERLPRKRLAQFLAKLVSPSIAQGRSKNISGNS